MEVPNTAAEALMGYGSEASREATQIPRIKTAGSRSQYGHRSFMACMRTSPNSEFGLILRPHAGHAGHAFKAAQLGQEVLDPLAVAEQQAVG